MDSPSNKLFIPNHKKKTLCNVTNYFIFRILPVSLNILAYKPSKQFFSLLTVTRPDVTLSEFIENIVCINAYPTLSHKLEI